MQMRFPVLSEMRLGRENISNTIRKAGIIQLKKGNQQVALLYLLSERLSLYLTLSLSADSDRISGVSPSG